MPRTDVPFYLPHRIRLRDRLFGRVGRGSARRTTIGPKSRWDSRSARPTLLRVARRAVWLRSGSRQDFRRAVNDCQKSHDFRYGQIHRWVYTSTCCATAALWAEIARTFLRTFCAPSARGARAECKLVQI